MWLTLSYFEMSAFVDQYVSVIGQLVYRDVPYFLCCSKISDFYGRHLHAGYAMAPNFSFFFLHYFSDLVMKSCSQVAQNSFTSNRVHYIFPDGGDPMEVFCDMTTDGGGWTVIQRRLDGSVDFYLGWESYKNGFGDVNGEFWLGNDNIHRLTAAHDVILRIDMEDFDGNITYAEYTTFQVTDEADKYRITIGGYSGKAGDSMKVK